MTRLTDLVLNSQEVGKVTHQILPTERLDEPDADDDFCPAEVDPPEAVTEADTFLQTFLKFIRVLNHSYGLVGIEA